MFGERHSFLPATQGPPQVYLIMALGLNYAQGRALIQVDNRSMDLSELQSNSGSYDGYLLMQKVIAQKLDATFCSIEQSKPRSLHPKKSRLKA